MPTLSVLSTVLIATLAHSHLSFLSSSSAAFCLCISGSAIRVLPGLKRTNWPQGSSSRTDGQTNVARIPSLKGREGGREKVAAEREIECLQLQFSLPSLGVGSVLSVDLIMMIPINYKDKK